MTQPQRMKELGTRSFCVSLLLRMTTRMTILPLPDKTSNKDMESAFPELLDSRVSLEVEA
ncbi:hypothetical protein AALP_AAs40221U000200 [Arabis alpina]|uniref:Uncharacterized protein n=1 Tax=Arabis alpina TaxID=50452 RepID=A0A087FZZ5_ARAAL|nr:hypothetical protein AALP_AAs40221U000200 [Arabis alpina]